MANGVPADRLNEELVRHFIEEDAMVRAYVRAVTRGHRDTDDVIQEVWRVACRKIAEYDTRRSFRSWVMGITRLQLLQWRQSLARSREVLAPDVVELLAETVAAHRDELDLRNRFLNECLARLPKQGREILELKYHASLTSEGIAARLSKTTGAVEMALVRLRRALRRCIEGKLTAESRGLS